MNPTCWRGCVAVLRPASAVVACALLASGAFGQTLSWDGSCGNNNWNSTCGPNTNWTREGIPAINNNVSIGNGSPIVLLSAPGFCNQITCQTGLTIDNTTLRLGLGGSISGLNMPSTFSEIEFANAGGTLLLTNSATWTVGTIDGAGTVWNLGTLNGSINPSAMTMTLMNGATFANAGSANATLRFLTINANCEVVNQSGATLTLRADNLSGFANGAGVLSNAGDLVFQFANSTTKEVNAFINQTGGQMIVQGVPSNINTWLTNAGNWSGGAIVVNNDCNLRFQHPGAQPLPYVMNGLTSISGMGNVWVEIPSGAPATADWQVTAQLDVNLTGTNGFVLAGTRCTLGAELTNLGKALWSSGTMRATACNPCTPKFINQSSAFTINTGGSVNSVRLDTTFENDGAVTHPLGILILDDDGVFVNNGTYLLSGTNSIRRLTANVTGTFFNHGTFTGTSNALVTAIFRNEPSGLIANTSGVVEFSSGCLRLAGGDVLTNGIVELSSGTHVAEQATDTNISGPGNFVLFAQGVLRVDDGATVLLTCERLTVENGSAIGGAGLVDCYSKFSWSGVVGVDGEATVIGRGETSIGLGGGAAINGAASTFVNAETGVVRMFATKSVNVLNGAVIVNEGQWTTPNQFGGTANVNGTNGLFTNAPTGVLTVNSSTNGETRTLDIHTPFENFGTVILQPLTTLIIRNSNDVVNGHLTRGTWLTDSGTLLRFLGHTITELDAGVHLRADSNALPDFELTTNGGTIEATGPFNSTTRIQNNGTMNAAPGPITTPGPINNGGFSVLSFADEAGVFAATQGTGASGYGCSTFSNLDMGVVRPGGPDAAGAFHVDGNFTQVAGATLQIELAGLTAIDEHDQLIVDGNIAIAGTLEVSILPGYEPKGGEQFTIVSATGGGTISGTFAQIVGAGTYSAQYNATNVVLTLVTPPPPACIGDIVTSATFAPPPDGQVNGADLAYLLGNWGANPGSPADLVTSATFAPPPDGFVNGADLAYLLGAWGDCK